MGSASSKFRKHLQSGDEVQALQLYRTNTELRKVLDPNCSYGDSHHHETPLHLASRHGMQTLLGIFLFSKGGNPNKTNARKETCLHNACMETNWQSVHVCKRRSECLNYLLKWRGAKLGESNLEKIDLAAQDEKQNTALHYAAASGLAQCVETLVTYGAPLFVENEDNLTPCDTAERSGHARIALYLESKMVFSNDEEPPEQEDNVSMPPIEEYSGLRPQDLQEAKDQLLVETADMLSVPLFTAEALLRNHEWSREMLLEAWMTDPVACCEKCGVTPPSTLFSEKPEVQENLASPLPSPLHSAPIPLDAECDICANTFLIADEPVHMTCTHRFCKECWERYLNVKIQEGDAHHITCPAYDCTMLVPVDIIEGIVSRDMARRYLQFDIKAFVDSNPDMKWCPFPGCGRAVKLPELDTNRSSGIRNKIPSDTSRGVDCGVGHYFCWECLEESHEPCSCDNWSKWFQKISEIRPETLNGTEQETEVAANCLWLVTNSKPCPNCKSPIQKNEGCNHMKCSKCKYDFCWVCLEQWKWHNSSTGGYFKCNRFEVVKKVEEQSAQLMNEAESKNKNMQELNRFVHYYTRFKNHENSFKLEEPLLKTAKDKMMKLAEAVTDNATAHAETKFVEDAVQQLLKARRVLKCSYVYGYYLEGPGYKKIVFEFMQTELEECTEILSQMVNRLYLRTPRRKIMDQACIVQRKRHEFIMAISKGLVPPETPPSVRKNKKRRKFSTDAVDEDLHRAIVASIQEVDPANPWIKDASGRHTNLVALLEWPSEDSDDDSSEVESDLKAKRESIGKCQRPSCNKVKARNPRTKGLHDYCSRWCMLVDKEMSSEGKSLTQVAMDEHMELLRALEMSRLQYLRDSGLLHDLDMPLKSNQPRGHKVKHRPRSNSTGQEVKKKPQSGLSSIEELGIELQRFQELSSGFPKGGQDREADLKQFGVKSNHRHPRKPSQSSRFEESKSTVVTRVPNKSVEDLYCLDPSLKGPVFGQASKSPILAAHSSPSMTKVGAEGKSSPPEKTVSSDVSPASTEDDHGAACSKSANLFGSMFGVIKDLSVSNIHSSENDKTKDFLSKDLASIFSGWDLDDNGEDITEAETSSHSQIRFNNLSPSYSPKRSNIRGSPLASSSSGKGNSGKSSAGKSLLKPDRSAIRPDFPAYDLATEDNVTRNRDGDHSRKRFYQSSSMTKEDDLARAGATAGDVCNASEEDEKEGSSRADKDGEVSLLKMAENLLQMTADVHSRMKAVERGIRDLEGICDLDARSKVKSAMSHNQRSDAYPSNKRERSLTSSKKDNENKKHEEGCNKTDFEDVDQWFDVSEAISQNSSAMNDKHKTREEFEKQWESHYKSREVASASGGEEDKSHSKIHESVIPSSIDQKGIRASSVSSSSHISKSCLSECTEASGKARVSSEDISGKSIATCKNWSDPARNVHAIAVADKETLEESPILLRSATPAYVDEQLAYCAKYYSKDNLMSQCKKNQEADEESLASASTADKRTKLLLPLQRAGGTSTDMGFHFSSSSSDETLPFSEASESSRGNADGGIRSSNFDSANLAKWLAMSSPSSNVTSQREKENMAKSLHLKTDASKNTLGVKEAETSEGMPSTKEEDDYLDSVYV